MKKVLKGDQSVIDILRKIDQIGFSAISVGNFFQDLKVGQRKKQTGMNSTCSLILRE
jgi:hypothetical protein